MAEGLADTKAKIRDLDDLLRKALHDKHKLGQSKQNLLWLQVWHKMQPHRVKPCSDALGIMPSIPESHMRNYSNTGQAKCGQEHGLSGAYTLHAWASTSHGHMLPPLQRC